MTASQKAGWRYAIAEAPPGLLKRLDRSILSVWVIAEDLHRDAAEKIAKWGSVIKAPATNTPMQSPYVSILNKQAAIMMKASAEMGFTPSSRSRVKIEPHEKQKRNRFEALKEIGDD